MLRISLKNIDRLVLLLIFLFECNATLAKYNIIQYFLMFLLMLIMIRSRTIKVDNMLLTMALFLAWNVLTIVWTIDLMSSIGTVVMIAKWLFILLYMSSNKENILFFLFGYSFVNFINAIILFPNIEYGMKLGRRGHHIVHGVEWSTNTTCGMFSIAVFFIFLLFLKEMNKKKKIFLLIMIIPLIVDILLMGSRQGIMVSLGSCLLLYLFINKGRRLTNKAILGLITLLFTVVGIIWVVFNNETLYRTIGYRIAGAVDTIQSDRGRLEMIRVGLKLFINKPILGYGTNTFYYSSNHLAGYAHNNFVELLADTGILGFVFYHLVYLFIFIDFRRIKDKFSRAVVLTSVLISLFLEMIIVTFPLFHYQFVLWIAYTYVSKFKKNGWQDKKVKLVRENVPAK